jgi:molecular chaperone DnaK
MADSAVYSAEKFIADNGENLPEAQKAAVQSQIDAAKSALEGGDSSAMKVATEKLQAVMQEAGAAMYQQQAAGADGAAPGGTGSDGASGDGAGTDEDVIEGEFSDA